MKVFYEKLKTKKPIKVWLEHLTDIEDSCLEQAVNLSNLPHAYKWIALMSDTHAGVGMPIGGVLALEEAIVPNAVGVDIGCLDRDSEFLTPNGWKKISEYNGEKVLQYNKFKDESCFVEPWAYIKKPCESFYHFKNTKGLDQMLSSEHRVLVWKGYKGGGFKESVDLRPHEICALGNKLDRGYYNIKCSFSLDSQDKVNLTEDEIRLDIAIAADGCIRDKKEGFNKIEFHLSKDRKIKRLTELLDKCSIVYNKCDSDDKKTIYITFWVKDCLNKNLSKYWKASKEQLQIITEECLLWDGHEGYRSYFSSTDKKNADIVQFAFAANNIRAGISIQKYEKDSWKDSYIVTPTKNNMINITNTFKEVKSTDGFKYCFTVPSGYFVARRNGKIFITGNCGMSAVKSNLIGKPNNDTLEKILEVGNRIIPNGMGGRHKHAVDDLQMPRIPSASKEPICLREYTVAKHSLGTLGGGNHFIELQLDEEDCLWIMLHSGSRNLGKQICDHYNRIAKELHEKWGITNCPKDLNWLPVDLKQAQLYLNEMTYALEFALKNRYKMMYKMMEIVENCLKKYEDRLVSYPEEIINIHHNYASREEHFGKDVWVHRKGATAAFKGQKGIIPGSMGTSSYIVEGLGNPESFMSCSHGAGRIMGRKQFNRTHDVDDCRKDMEGIIYKDFTQNKKGEYQIDESPKAYKNIDQVMENQKDLVKIITKLRPIMSLKG